MSTTTAVAVIDRTLILDPATLWPDPLTCPDWPLMSSETASRSVVDRRRDALERELNAIARQVNADARHLRAPTDAEREAMFSAMFEKGRPTDYPRWSALGLRDINPRERGRANEAQRLVEAAHLRGYLRKIDAIAAKAATEKERADKERAEERLRGFSEFVKQGEAELAGAAEAVQRHRQRIEDEKAFRRVRDLRLQLDAAHFEASQAARQLGIDPPEKPEWNDG